jgi:hypothetical protein
MKLRIFAVAVLLASAAFGQWYAPPKAGQISYGTNGQYYATSVNLQQSVSNLDAQLYLTTGNTLTPSAISNIVAVAFAADSVSYVNSAMAAYLLNQNHWYLPGTFQYFDSAVFSNFVEFASLVQFDQPVIFSNSVNVLDSVSVGTNLLVGSNVMIGGSVAIVSNLVVGGTLTVNDQVNGNLLVGGSLYASQLVNGVSGVVAGFKDYGYPTAYSTNSSGVFNDTTNLTGGLVGNLRQYSFETNIAYTATAVGNNSATMLETGFTNKFDSAVEAKRVTGLWGVRGNMDNVSPVEMYPGWRVVAIGGTTKTNPYTVTNDGYDTNDISVGASAPGVLAVNAPWTNYYSSAWASFSSTGTVSLLTPGLYRVSCNFSATGCVHNVRSGATDSGGSFNYYLYPASEIRICLATNGVSPLRAIATGVGSGKGPGAGAYIAGSGSLVIAASAAEVDPIVVWPGVSFGATLSGYAVLSGVLTDVRVIVEYQPFWRNDATGTPTTNGPPGTTVTSPIPLF